MQFRRNLLMPLCKKLAKILVIVSDFELILIKLKKKHMKKIYQLSLTAVVGLVLGVNTTVNAQCTTPPSPTVPNPTICTGNSATLTATGASSLMTGWYQNSFGGNAIGTGSAYVTPTLSANTNYYVAQLAPTTPASITLPPHGSNYSGMVRGYWFTAPSDFVITGVRVPTDASAGNSNIAILRMDTVAPLFPILTNSFSVLYLTQNNTSGTGIIPVNIPVYSGQSIMVLGNRADLNSYSTAGTITATFGAYTLNLVRSGMQFNLSSTAPTSVWTQASGSISRVELYTTLGCLNPLKTASVTVNSCSTGLDELSGTTLQVFPNPSSGKLTVEIGVLNTPTFIEITDALGKVVFASEVLSPSSTFDISALSGGAYTYKISNASGSSRVGKLVKE